MFTVLLLAGVEKIINLSLATDPITQHNLQQLNGKTLRIVIGQPRLKMDVLFNDKRIRFEPVISQTPIFEPKLSDNNALNRNLTPNATIFAENITHLLEQFNQNSLSKYPSVYEDEPLQHDEQFLADVEHLLANFDPDIIGKLQNIVGLPIASQLAGLFDMLKNNHTNRQSFYPQNDFQQQSYRHDNHQQADRLDPQTRLTQLEQQVTELQKQIEIEKQKLEKSMG